MNERDGFIGFAHHGRAAAAADDFVDRAAHVEIHDADADGLEELRGGAEFLFDGAEDLHRERLVVGARLDQFVSLAALFDQRASVDEVGGGETEAA